MGLVETTVKQATLVRLALRGRKELLERRGTEGSKERLVTRDYRAPRVTGDHQVSMGQKDRLEIW